MAHTAANPRDIYRRLGKKIDGLATRVARNAALYDILRALYTPEEAEVLVKMPFGLASLERITRVTGIEAAKLRPLLESLAEKGLVVDVCVNDRYRYAPSPMVVGIFEMTMMRTRGELKYVEWANLFRNYLSGDGSFYAANFGHGEKLSVMRALPHEEVIDATALGEGDFVEVLDYEKASAIVEDSTRFAMGLCSCRHEKLHLGEKTCKTPLDTCSSFGSGADYLIRHGFAREVSKSEMKENFARSKELKLALTADNVQKRVGFICHCCGCCCNLMLGVTKHGYPGTIVTSSYLSMIEQDKCTGCEKCAKKCPVQAIAMVPIAHPKTKKPKDAIVDQALCIGCGVCALTCHKDAVKLVPRQQRVLCPESTFERVILASLERGTLQNQLFDDPQSRTQQALRGIVGGFLRLPPVKQALMSDQLRSRFLASLKRGVSRQPRARLVKA